MYCSSCGIAMDDTFRFCPHCGAAGGNAAAPSGPRLSRSLVRPRMEKKLAGVCAGLANYFGVDVTLIRILVVVLSIWPPGVGLIFYLVCWVVMPQEPLLLPPASVVRDAQGAAS